MKRLNLLKTNMCMAVLLVVMLFNHANAQYVHTQGTKIVDGNGKDLYFTGMNLGNWLLWEGYLMMGDFNYRTHTQFFNSAKTAFGGDLAKAMEFEHQWRLNYVTNESIRELKGLGFNSVRVPFHFNLFWDYNSAAVSDRGFQYFDRVIQYCRDNGVYILFDMHAAPGYQNPGDHSDNVESNSSQPRGTVHFWDNGNVDIASKVWKHIANHYKNETIIWGYDLLNEPVPQPGREFELLRSMKTMTDAIRQVDTNHVIVAEGSWWGSELDKLDWTNGSVQSVSGINSRWDNNLVYETHHYSTDASALNGRLDITNKLNLPMILGEYGESDNGSLRSMTDWCISHNVGYFPWSFKKMSFDKCLWTVNPNGPYNTLKDAINSNSAGPSSLYNDIISFCQNNIKNGAAGLSWHQDFYDAVKNNTTPPPPPPSGGVATCYEHCDFGGFAIALPEGDYNLAALSSRGITNDQVSSVRVNAGYEIVGYKDDNFTGTSITLGSENACLVDEGWNDQISSLRVRKTTTTGSFSVKIQAESNFQNAGIQTENTSDTDGGQNVGWLDAGDWMAYAVNIPSTGSYKVEYRVASPNGTGSLKIEPFGGGQTFGTMAIPNTGGWQTWTTVSHNVTLNAGQQNIAIAVVNGGWNFNWFKISTAAGARIGGELIHSESPADENKVSLSPNPAADQLTIDGTLGFSQVMIFGLDGRKHAEHKIAHVNRVNISISSLNQGMYFVRLVRENGSHRVIKFIKE